MCHLFHGELSHSNISNIFCIFFLQKVKCSEILSQRYRDGHDPKMLYTPEETSPLLLFRLEGMKKVSSVDSELFVQVCSMSACFALDCRWDG